MLSCNPSYICPIMIYLISCLLLLQFLWSKQHSFIFSHFYLQDVLYWVLTVIQLLLIFSCAMQITFECMCVCVFGASQHLPHTSCFADRCSLNVWRSVHGCCCIPAGHSDDRELPAVSSPQTMALRTTLHEPLQRGQCHLRARITEKYKPCKPL